MSSTTVAQHPTQPLNFGPEWLRALSTPESTTPISSAGGSAAGGGNIFKFATSKYRYSKDEILALRANVTERLAEDIRNEILGNLRDVESVFRPNIIEPLALTAPNAEESAKMSSLSSYISGRTPGGGGGRGGGNAPQSQQQQHDSRNGRGGPNAGVRGGARGRGGRDTGFGPNRGNNHAEEGENGGGGGGGDDDPSAPSASWSTRGGYHSRGGASFGNRVRSYDDREPPFRRGGGPGTRQTSDTWRRSRGDEDEGNNEQNEDPSANTTNGSSSWSSRGGAARRGGSTGGSMDHRNKSNEKWSHVDDRSGPSGNFQSSQQRGWRPTTAMSDRDLNSRRPQPKQEHMPEWMDDGNDGDNPMSNATFEQDGTFTGSSSTRHGNNENDKPKPATQPSNEDKPAGHGRTNASKPHEAKKSGKTTPPQADTAVVNIPSVSETNVPKPTPPLQQPAPTWDDEFEPSDVATTVVEATLAEDHEYSPPVSSHPTPPAVPIIPTQRAPQPPPPVLIDDKQWFYKDPQHTVQGPFSSADMERWFTAGYFTIVLPVKRMGETHFSTIQQLTKELGRLPFRADAPSLPPPVQQPVMPEPQKFNPMTYAAPSSAAHNYIDDFLVQQQRQNAQNAMLFNRQTSVPLATADRKPVASPAMLNPQLQTYFGSQQQQHSQSSSSIFSPGLATDPAILYQQQPQLQRSTSVTNQQQALFDEAQRSFRHITSQPNAVSFFGTNIAGAQSQQPDDIMTRLAQAMQNHGQQQQEKIDEQRRLDQQRRELDIERLKLVQQAEQLRLQREEDERRQLEQQQKLEEEIRKKKEAAASNKQILDQMKEMAKTLDQKKPQPQPPQQQQQVKAQQPKTDVDQFLAFQQSLQYQKEQQAKIEAQKIENVRRYQQQQLREQSQPSPQQQQQQQQQQQSFKLPDSANWARHPSQGNDQNQPLNFAEIQRQEQEQERRAREAALSAQQLAKSETSNTSNPSSSSNSNKPGSWARTLFAGGNVNAPLGQSSTDPDTNEPTTPASPMTSYNQQATNAVLSLLNIHPKSRSSASQPSTPWSSTANLPNTSLQDIQRQQQQQSQSEVKPATPQVQPQSTSSGHSTPAWGGVFQQPAGAASSQSSSSIFWADTQPTAPAKPSNATGGHKSSTPWSDVKPVPAPAPKSTSSAAEQSKSEREAKHLFTATRTQDALSKWAQTQFKDNLQAIDVPTLVQLLKDIDSAEEIVEYVQPYVGSVMKSKEFAKDFIAKRKQLANAGPEIDNDHLNELAMAPASSHSGSAHGGDEGFQLASSNGQKKKAKKMKGQKIDVKQLGFMVNNRPEQRDDIDRVQM